eukprot:74157_1
MCEGRNERSKESLDCTLGWENWRNLAYDHDCGDGIRSIEALKILREIFFSGEGSDDDFIRIVKEDGSNLPRWLLQQCINEEVVREDGGEIAFQCLAMCSSIDRITTWMYRDSKDMSDLLISISRAVESQYCPPFSSDSCQNDLGQISGLVTAALTILEEVLMATEQLVVVDRGMCGIGCTNKYCQGILINSLMKLMESGEEPILLLTCRLLAFLNYLSPFCAGPLVLRGVKHHKNRGDILSCLLHLFNSEKFPCTLHIAELLIDLAETEVILNTSDMLACIDICLRELVNLPGSQKLLKKRHANLLRSFIISKKWKVAGVKYREKDIKEILQAEGWDEL